MADKLTDKKVISLLSFENYPDGLVFGFGKSEATSDKVIRIVT